MQWDEPAMLIAADYFAERSIALHTGNGLYSVVTIIISHDVNKPIKRPPWRRLRFIVFIIEYGYSPYIYMCRSILKALNVNILFK